MYRSILVPLDGSTFSEQALPLALSIARRSNAAVRLAHVHTSAELVYAAGDIPIIDDTLDKAARAGERAYLDGLAQRLASRWSLPVTCTLLEGDIEHALYTYTIAAGVDLVVMSTHARGPLGHFWHGSVAETLVRRSSLPILLVRPHQEALDLLNLAQEHTPQRILIPLDGSALAEAALEQAIELGEPLGAEYTLLQAIDPVALAYAPSAALAGLNETPIDTWIDEARAYLEAIAEHLRTRGLRVQTTIITAAPTVAIPAYARQHLIDLIAMTTHGRSGISRLLLGSVADQVVRTACVPVFLRRPPERPAGFRVASSALTLRSLY